MSDLIKSEKEEGITFLQTFNPLYMSPAKRKVLFYGVVTQPISVAVLIALGASIPAAIGAGLITAGLLGAQILLHPSRKTGK